MLTIGSYLCRNLSDSGSPDQAVVFDALEVVGIKHTEHTKKGRLYFIIVSITKGPPWVIWPSSDVDLMLYCPVSAEVMRSRYPWMLLSQLITWRAHAHTHKSLHTRTHTKTQMFVYGIKTTRNPAWNKSFQTCYCIGHHFVKLLTHSHVQYMVKLNAHWNFNTKRTNGCGK